MPTLMAFVGNIGYVAVCVMGAILVINNHITFGVIVAFMIYIRLFTNPLSQIAQALSSLQPTAAAAGRVFSFLEESEMKKETVDKKLDKDKIKGNIEFKDIEFGYVDDKTIIKNFSAKVKAGSKVAIVGPTGAGKTTMVNLLMKFYDIDKGDILIDNVSIKDLSRSNIHDLFTMVLQDTWVFTGTIKDNIRYNNKNITDKEIEKICKTVGLHHFIKTLPKGYNTELNEVESLSSGQKQLLTIARAMVNQKPLLILDEATKGRTSFIIAHRLSTIRNADLILVMNEGNIIEQGTHNELLKKNGFYSELYNSQFETVE